MHPLTRPLGAALLALGSLAAARAAEDLPDFTALVERNLPAVVSVSVSTPPEAGADAEAPANPFEGTPLEEPLKRFFEQLPELEKRMPGLRPPPTASIGSGFIVSGDGYILSNAHVVGEARTVSVGLADRRRLEATVVGRDARSDVALLKIDASDLPTVKIGDSDQLRVGQWVLAIGSPFGFESSATVGIVSALGRSLPSDSYVPFIQTDAAVNPGNSGGPLFDTEGRVVGINSQIYSRSGGYQGLSFAIPIKVAMDVAEQLKTRGRVARGWLGVTIQDLTPELAKSFGLDAPRGALIAQVQPGGPAAKAGLKPGDIVLAYDGRPLARSGELPPRVGATAPGSSVKLTLFRDGRETELALTVGELSEAVAGSAKAPAPAGNPLGATLAELEADARARGERGVRVRELTPNGPAARAGLRPGDVIERVRDRVVDDVPAALEALRAAPRGTPLPLLVRRGDAALFLAVTLAD